MRNKLVKINIVILVAEFLAHFIMGVTLKNSGSSLTVLSVLAISGIWSGLAFFLAAVTGLALYLKPGEKLFFIMTQIRFVLTFAAIAVNAFIYFFVAIANGIAGEPAIINGFEILLFVLFFVPPVATTVLDTVAVFLKRREELQKSDPKTNPYYKRIKVLATIKPVVLTIESVLSGVCLVFMFLLAFGF